MSAPLRIGLVCPYAWRTPGGVQNHVLGLAGWLSRSGHHVQVLAPGRPALAAAERHGLHPDQFTSAGRAVAVPYNGSVARIGFGPVTHQRVRSWVAGSALDVLHLHEPITPSAAVHALWSAGALPVVATFHTATPRSRTMHLARRVLRDTVARIDAGIAVSEIARQVVLDHLGRDAVIIPNGIDHDQLSVTPPGSAGSGDRGGAGVQLVYLGRLNDPRKGLDVLLRAWPMIRRRHPGAELVLAGAGRRQLPEGCRALGVVSDDVRTDLLHRADLVIAPHRGRESFGLVVAEAMAAGAQVVASDIPAFVDVLTGVDGARHGQLFSAGRPAALAAAVDRAIRDEGFGEVTAGRAEGRAEERRCRVSAAARRYDWSEVAPQVVEVYRRTVAARHGAGVSPPGSPGLATLAE